jgi:hypothetical protein
MATKKTSKKLRKGKKLSRVKPLKPPYKTF